MTAFLYYAPGPGKLVTADRLKELGVEYAFDASPASCDINGRTPTGGQGWLFADTSGGMSLAYRGDEQTWRKIPKSELWIGYYKDALPTPDTLARANQLDGDKVRLDDGNQWQVPRLRLFSGDDGFQVALPQKVDMDDDGVWVVGGVNPQHNRLNEIADRLYEAMVTSLAGEDESIKPLSSSEALDFTCELLQVNYRVSKIEAVQLGLLGTQDSLMAACDAAMDYDTALEWVKKKETENVRLADVG